MHPRLAWIGSSSEAFFQFFHIQRDTFQLLRVEFIWFIWLRAFFLATQNQEFSHVRRALQGCVQGDPFASCVLLPQVVQHCTLGEIGRVTVVRSVIDVGLVTAHLLKDLILHLQCCRQGLRVCVSQLNIVQVDAVRADRRVQHCVEAIVEELHLFICIFFASFFRCGRDFALSCENLIQHVNIKNVAGRILLTMFVFFHRVLLFVAFAAVELCIHGPR